MIKNSAPRVLIYSQDGFGLGHLRRNLNICLQFKKVSPDSSILMIADSPVAPFFKLPPKCDFIKIPTIVKVDAGIWRPDSLPVDYRELLKIRSEIIRNVALSFQPHVFMVDHMPHGALGELYSPLKAIKKKSPHTKIVLGLRDILGAPDVIHKQWQVEGAFQAANDFYDIVHIYGCRDVFDSSKQYKFPESIVKKTRYCGYICRDEMKHSLPIKKLKKLFGEREGKFILVTGGGSADASYFMDKFIDAVRLLHSKIKINALIGIGPFMHRDQRQLLRNKAKGLPIAVAKTGQASIQYLKRADLVISMCGYNTMTEILNFRKNAIIIPRSGPSAEQTMRTNLLSQRGLISSIHPNKLTTENFSELISERLNNGHSIDEAQMPNLHGAHKVATSLLENM